jgi:hypothetical protein
LQQHLSLMGYPRVKFRISKALDKQMIREFLRYPEKGGINFAEAIFEIHPELKNSSKMKGKQRGDFLNNYIDQNYQHNKISLQDAKQNFQEKWDAVAPDFFAAVDKIFEGLSWPKGDYNGYVSVLPCGPRFLKTKSFQSPMFWPDHVLGQIIHEMLHFQFYNQVAALGLDAAEDNDETWHLSEIFNDIVQREEPLTLVQGYVSEISYPDHEKEHDKYKIIWQETGSASKFITKALKNA